LLPLFTHSASNISVLVYSSSVLPGMVPLFVILISHLRFRKLHQDELANHPFKMPGAPWTNWIALIGLIIILLFMFINPETQASIIVGVIFEVILVICYFVFQPASLKAARNKK
ncbi:amino acid permease, partial [Lactobacillus sp. XV13L]|nr:amino acid permease [Lactobacillus sp. XV13L]